MQMAESSFLKIPDTDGVVTNYSNLNVTLTGNAQLRVQYSYQDSGRGCFNGTFYGPQYYLTMSEPTQSNNRYNYITGPGNWRIRGLILNQDGFGINIQTSNICGASLELQSGFMILAADTEQNVFELSIGGSTNTIVGTYGSTASGADFQSDDFFQGTGVIILNPPPKGTLFLFE